MFGGPERVLVRERSLRRASVVSGGRGERPAQPGDSAVPHEHASNRAEELVHVAKVRGCAMEARASLTQSAICLCRNGSVCASVLSELPPISMFRAMTDGKSKKAFRGYMDRSRPMRLAVQCMHLLLWANINELLVKWALVNGGLAESGEYLRWQSEVTLDPHSARNEKLINAFEMETLRRRQQNTKVKDEVEPQKLQRQLQPQREKRERRRLAYGKWHEVSENDLKSLDHCGHWRDVMIDLFECGDDDHLPSC